MRTLFILGMIFFLFSCKKNIDSSECNVLINLEGLYSEDYKKNYNYESMCIDVLYKQVVNCSIIHNESIYDTINYFFNLKQFKNSEIQQKIFILNKEKYVITKYRKIQNELVDGDYEIYVTENNKLIIYRDISWIKLHLIYRNEIEEKIINLILADTSGFYTSSVSLVSNLNLPKNSMPPLVPACQNNSKLLVRASTP